MTFQSLGRESGIGHGKLEVRYHVAVGERTFSPLKTFEEPKKPNNAQRLLRYLSPEGYSILLLARARFLFGFRMKAATSHMIVVSVHVIIHAEGRNFTRT